ncbi:MAG: hypothetical protein COU06_00800 [Candidatus Harrisonbacteria bacterium CG10_big_fil_rev_8_21_14_0_10_38_8]|uniref:Uncharacterized protein n=1 Tax=Candidatus Harrisonbacteria bacterium CG10_big_fil_rev_8_21_14_0_10_38_8 TaxID=1974582 RepID=A0A2M6WKF5_9BACT|nr:MAG: hypothetical protein COU06_00800 [Candidatus Harrisonbacteria bacterium CG10_big_fil_rev_8_21_14_0_10_38_8]
MERKEPEVNKEDLLKPEKETIDNLLKVCEKFFSDEEEEDEVTGAKVALYRNPNGGEIVFYKDPIHLNSGEEKDILFMIHSTNDNDGRAEYIDYYIRKNGIVDKVIDKEDDFEEEEEEDEDYEFLEEDEEELTQKEILSSRENYIASERKLREVSGGPFFTPEKAVRGLIKRLEEIYNALMLTKEKDEKIIDNLRDSILYLADNLPGFARHDTVDFSEPAKINFYLLKVLKYVYFGESLAENSTLINSPKLNRIFIYPKEIEEFRDLSEIKGVGDLSKSLGMEIVYNEEEGIFIVWLDLKDRENVISEFYNISDSGVDVHRFIFRTSDGKEIDKEIEVLDVQETRVSNLVSLINSYIPTRN